MHEDAAASAGRWPSFLHRNQQAASLLHTSGAAERACQLNSGLLDSSLPIRKQVTSRGQL